MAWRLACLASARGRAAKASALRLMHMRSGRYVPLGSRLDNPIPESNFRFLNINIISRGGPGFLASPERRRRQIAEGSRIFA